MNRKPPMSVVRTGTDNMPMAMPLPPSAAPAVVGADHFSQYDTPAVFRRPRDLMTERVGAGIDEPMAEARLEIPAFLRKQAD